MVLPAHPKDRAAGEEAVNGGHNGQFREPSLDFGGDAVERLEFTILLGICAGVFYKLREHGDGECVGCHEFCFQNHVIVRGLAGLRLSKTPRAVSFLPFQSPSSVDGNEKVAVQEPVRIQDFLANEAVYRAT